MCAFCEHDAQTIGEFLGYHQCCIDWFVGHAEKYGRGDTEHFTEYQTEFHKATEGIAFIACPSHAKEYIEGELLLSELVSNRICSSPFPYSIEEDDEEEFLEWLNLKS
jgi:hypothetical protein